LVRTQHLPPPAETARELGFARRHGPLFVVSSCVIGGHQTPLCGDGYGHIADRIRAGGAVHRTACWGGTAAHGGQDRGCRDMAWRGLAVRQLPKAGMEERPRGPGLERPRIKSALFRVCLLPDNAGQCHFVRDSAHFAAVSYRTLSNSSATCEQTWSKHGHGDWAGSVDAVRNHRCFWPESVCRPRPLGLRAWRGQVGRTQMSCRRSPVRADRGMSE
jgi:hypothetical protein